MFNKCKGKRDEIDKKKTYKTLGISDSWLENKAKDLVEEISQLLARESRNKDSNLRDDYKQCAELTLAVVGYTPPEFVSHHCPGATHLARWRSQVSYCQKMYMWAEQLSYDATTVAKLQRFVQFLVLFYVPAWLKCSVGTDAAINVL